LATVYDSANTMYAKAFITYTRATVPTPTVPAADVFGTGILH
jgi:hypothetical protein